VERAAAETATGFEMEIRWVVSARTAYVCRFSESRPSTRTPRCVLKWGTWRTKGKQVLFKEKARCSRWRAGETLSLVVE
jgi:hypothetical protein